MDAKCEKCSKGVIPQTTCKVCLDCYHALDKVPVIRSVVKEMRDAVELYESVGGKGVLTVNITLWANQLEGK